MTNIVTIPQPLQLKDYQIRFNSGQTINEPIENINELNEIIHIYGRSTIAKISFYFHNSIRRFHNIILRNTETNDRFIVEFYHYYNQQNQRIELTFEEQFNDFTVVMNCLIQNQYINLNLIPYIINPFHSIHMN